MKLTAIVEVLQRRTVASDKLRHFKKTIDVPFVPWGTLGYRFKIGSKLFSFPKHEALIWDDENQGFILQLKLDDPEHCDQFEIDNNWTMVKE